MSIFKFFNQTQSTAKWELLEEENQLLGLEEKSNEGIVLIFKHSTRCGISHQSKSELESWSEQQNEQASVYYLDLLKYRPISNLISERYQIPHQSPQLIAVVRGKAVGSISHASIDRDGIDRFYKSLLPLLSGNEK